VPAPTSDRGDVFVSPFPDYRLYAKLEYLGRHHGRLICRSSRAETRRTIHTSSDRLAPGDYLATWEAGLLLLNSRTWTYSTRGSCRSAKHRHTLSTEREETQVRYRMLVDERWIADHGDGFDSQPAYSAPVIPDNPSRGDSEGGCQAPVQITGGVITICAGDQEISLTVNQDCRVSTTVANQIGGSPTSGAAGAMPSCMVIINPPLSSGGGVGSEDGDNTEGDD
jgi:hypothetical protein